MKSIKCATHARSSVNSIRFNQRFLWTKLGYYCVNRWLNSRRFNIEISEQNETVSCRDHWLVKYKRKVLHLKNDLSQSLARNVDIQCINILEGKRLHQYRFDVVRYFGSVCRFFVFFLSDARTPASVSGESMKKKSHSTGTRLYFDEIIYKQLITYFVRAPGRRYYVGL